MFTFHSIAGAMVLLAMVPMSVRAQEDAPPEKRRQEQIERILRAKQEAVEKAQVELQQARKQLEAAKARLEEVSRAQLHKSLEAARAQFEHARVKLEESGIDREAIEQKLRAVKARLGKEVDAGTKQKLEAALRELKQRMGDLDRMQDQVKEKVREKLRGRVIEIEEEEAEEHEREEAEEHEEHEVQRRAPKPPKAPKPPQPPEPLKVRVHSGAGGIHVVEPEKVKVEVVKPETSQKTFVKTFTGSLGSKKPVSIPLPHVAKPKAQHEALEKTLRIEVDGKEMEIRLPELKELKDIEKVLGAQGIKVWVDGKEVSGRKEKAIEKVLEGEGIKVWMGGKEAPIEVSPHGGVWIQGKYVAVPEKGERTKVEKEEVFKLGPIELRGLEVVPETGFWVQKEGGAQAKNMEKREVFKLGPAGLRKLELTPEKGLWVLKSGPGHEAEDEVRVFTGPKSPIGIGGGTGGAWVVPSKSRAAAPAPAPGVSGAHRHEDLLHEIQGLRQEVRELRELMNRLHAHTQAQGKIH